MIRSSRPGRAFLACLITVAALTGLTVPAQARTSPRPIGDIGVFATLPYPGNPGGLLVDGNTLYVDTSAANFDRPFDGSDKIFAYNLRSGALVTGSPNPIAVPREYPVAAMGLAGMARDSAGRFYVADMNGRILRVDPRTGSQEVYATFPTNTHTALTDMPTFVVFAGDGSLYVSEAAGPPILWRVPPGGGQAQAWFVDPRLGGTWAGSVVGLTLDPTGKNLYLAAGNQEPGIHIYRLPLAHPDAGHLEEFHRYSDVVVTPCPPDPGLPLASCATTPLFGAGAIAFGKSGNLYVVFLSKNQVSILRPDGSEQARFPSPEENAQRDVPLNAPFDVAFDGRGSLLVSNTGDASSSLLPGGTVPPGGLPNSKSWVVFDIYVNDTANPLLRPSIP